MVGWPDRLLACTAIQLFLDLRSLRGLTTSVAVKAPVLCASTGNLTLSSTQLIDGIVVSTGDRDHPPPRGGPVARSWPEGSGAAVSAIHAAMSPSTVSAARSRSSM